MANFTKKLTIIILMLSLAIYFLFPKDYIQDLKNIKQNFTKNTFKKSHTIAINDKNKKNDKIQTLPIPLNDAILTSDNNNDKNNLDDTIADDIDVEKLVNDTPKSQIIEPEVILEENAKPEPEQKIEKSDTAQSQESTQKDLSLLDPSPTQKNSADSQALFTNEPEIFKGLLEDDNNMTNKKQPTKMDNIDTSLGAVIKNDDNNDDDLGKVIPNVQTSNPLEIDDKINNISPPTQQENITNNSNANNKLTDDILAQIDTPEALFLPSNRGDTNQRYGVKPNLDSLLSTKSQNVKKPYLLAKYKSLTPEQKIAMTPYNSIPVNSGICEFEHVINADDRIETFRLVIFGGADTIPMKLETNRDLELDKYLTMHIDEIDGYPDEFSAMSIFCKDMNIKKTLVENF